MLLNAIEILVIGLGITFVLWTRNINTIISYILFIIMFVPTSLRFSYINGFTTQSITISFIFSVLLLKRIIYNENHIKIELPKILCYYIFFIIYCFIISICNNKLTSLGFFYSNWLTLFLILIIIISNYNYINCSFIFKHLICYIYIVYFYCIIEFIFKHNFLYYSLLEKASTDYFKVMYRTFGTTNHPLTLANMLLMFLPIQKFLHNNKYLNRVNLTILNLLSILIISTTASRSAILLALIYFYLVYLNRRQKIVVTFFISVTWSFILKFLSNNYFTKILVDRFLTANSSTNVRLNIIENTVVLLKKTLFGKGLGASAEYYKVTFQTQDILENPWVAYLIDIGFLGLLLLITNLFILIKLFTNKEVFRNITGLISLTLVMFTSYNSISVHSNLVILLFLLVILISSQIKYLNQDFGVKNRKVSNDHILICDSGVYNE